MPNDTRLIAGAMSGTSADGVDVAITRITGRGLDMSAQLVHHHHRDYDPALKKAIFAVRSAGHTELRELARIGREVSLTYATAVNESLNAANLKATELAAIAAHGQTLFHDAPLTIQYFDPSLVAYEVGCPVISDFRRADLAAGGQGAPLVPFADYILFRHPTKSRVLLNLGGIANITYLRAGCKPEEVIAFDTGPANCIMDWLCRTYDPHGPGYDAGGAKAMKGKVLDPIVKAASRHPFFHREPPKSTDGPEMIALFEEGIIALGGSPSLEDLLATACWFAAKCTTVEIVTAGQADVQEIIASGGGTENPLLMTFLREGVQRQFLTTDELGVPSSAKEALAFALLGAATLDGLPSNVPSVTGASRGVVLGSITPKP